jgi:signal peptidase I
LDISAEDYSGSLVNASESAYEMIGIERNEQGSFNPVYQLPLTREALAKMEKAGWARSVHIEHDYFFAGGDTYPYGYDSGWSRDNYGPIWIPAKGATVPLNDKNLAIYSRCIINYEGNTLERKGNQILINGSPATNYTFKYDYYFMMGDNRHKSADSRSWGFVPEDHIVGKPILIWFSTDKDRNLLNGGIRWKRLFRTVSAE